MVFACEMYANAQYVNIPDPIFKNYLTTNYIINTDFDAEISFVEASAYAGEIVVDSSNIASLIGIEAFVNITKLFCDSNQIATLDISKNLKLTTLGCNDNKLTSLVLNTNLTNLYCENNNLAVLDVSKNVKLIYFWCEKNQITSLDLTQNVDLKEFGCYNNFLSNLDVSKNVKLEQLFCGDNPALNIDLTYNHNLIYFACENNSQTSLDFNNCLNLKFVKCSNNPLVSLSLSNNSNLTNLYCNNTLLTDLNLSNTTKITDLFFNATQLDTVDISTLVNLVNLGAYSNVGLKIIYVSSLQDTTLTSWYKDITAQYKIRFSTLYVNIPDPKFKAILVGDTLINTDGDAEISFIEAGAYTGEIHADTVETLIGIEAFTNIGSLRSVYSTVTSLDISKNLALRIISIQNGKLSNLDLSKNVALEYLELYHNNLTSLDVTNNVLLKSLGVMSNQLTSLDISKNVLLLDFYCDFNQLTSLDVSKNILLVNFYCGSNHLASLDLSKNADLGVLNCIANQLTALDVSTNTALTYLECSVNQIASLDISKNSALTTLSCGNNRLTSVDVTKNASLNTFNCGSNQLTSLDVSNNLSITSFTAQYNPSLYTICVAPSQNTSAWLKDPIASYSTNCARVSANLLSNDFYTLANTSPSTFLNVLANDNAVGIQNLMIDLQPDTLGVQQYVQTALGEFKVIAPNQLYFTPTNDTVGTVTINYVLADTSLASTSNKASITINTTSKLKFYSGFSPDGDDVNPSFFITNIRPNSILQLNVYDMNGFEIYTNANYDNKWEGLNTDGKKVAPATYYYIVQYKENSTAEFVQYNGFVEIKY
jgi:Leucine-rich repeat (LRR) protein